MFRNELNVYCDESCHLENDKINVMVLGAVWCPVIRKSQITRRIREIKLKHDLPESFEIKWNKISPAGYEFYRDILDYFFDDDDLHFRALIVPDKSNLDHDTFGQTHDDFYYKMYFDMLKIIFDPESSYNIYLDIKDTRSQEKVIRLRDYLRNAHYDYEKRIIKNIQQIRSHESEILQLADLLIGAMSYHHRGMETSDPKLKLIQRIKERSGYSLNNNTLPKEQKFNVFIWKGKRVIEDE